MFRTVLFSAVGAGIAVGIALSLVQSVTTEPLILHAETFENAAPPAHDHAHAVTVDGEATAAAPAVEAHHHDEDAWSPADGFERRAYTLLANLLMGVAVSLLILGGMTLRGGAIDAREGLLWGLGGFAAFALLPSLGLPPELPGTAAAEITNRQLWWLGTAAASAAGIAALVFGRGWPLRIAGVALLIVPHLVGAPEPPTLEAAYPAALGGEFVAASLVVSALLWVLSGLGAGWLHRRLTPA